MGWMPTVVVLTAIAVVALQSWQLFAQKTRASYVCGVLDLLVAISTLIGFFLFASGALIISPEFSVLLAQGTGSWIWAKASLIALSIGIGLVLFATRCEEQDNDTNEAKKQTRQNWLLPEIFWIVLVGTIVGVGARLELLNRPEPSVFFQIRCYDLWSPVLLAWILSCLSECITTAIGDVPLRIRVFSVAMLITGLGILAVDRAEIQHFRFASIDSLIVWPFIVWVGVPAVLAMGSWIFISRWVPRHVRHREAVLIAASILAAVAGLLSVWNWMRRFDATWIIRPWFLTTTCLVLLLLPEVPRLYRPLQTGRLSDYFQSRRGGKAVGLVAAVLLAASLADISHFSLFDPVWDIAAIIIGWVALLEAINSFPLWTLFRHGARQSVTYARDVRKVLQREPSATPESSDSGAQPSEKPVPEKLGGQSATLTSMLKSSLVIVVDVGIVLVLLIAALEFFNIGKTIVQPFSTDGLPEMDKDQGKDQVKELGKEVSDRIVNTIGVVNQKLRPDLLVISGIDRTAWIAAAGVESGGLQAAVKSADVQIPGTNVTIPFSLFAGPIQGFMRTLLGVRVISGSIQWDGNNYVLLVSSSKGETWRTGPPCPRPRPVRPRSFLRRDNNHARINSGRFRLSHR